MSTLVHSLSGNQKSSESQSSIVGGDFPLDQIVIAALPEGTSVVSANRYGYSAWTVTAKIETVYSDGSPRSYFLKCATADGGEQMIEGEFHAMTELYQTMPTLVPKPHAWGKFSLSTIDTSFLICDFVEMSNQLPDPKGLCSQIAELHRASASPTGKFGFHIGTCHGKFLQSHAWDSNWASFFARLLQRALDLDLETNGLWPELQQVSERVLTKVVPRLLGVLQADGRDIKPCLIHGDLWDGNIGTACKDNKICIFDAGAYYAHNEMEIGMWRCVRHGISAKVYTEQYLREFPASEPVEEWDDRNRIYCVKMNMIHSAHHKGDIVRQTAYKDMCYLVDKYAPWG